MSHSETIIDVKNITKKFDGKIAVDKLSLKINQGEIYGFLGPNGSGKTTTIRMICGLLTPDSGSGTCLGFDIVKESVNIKARVGYMAQTFSLYQDLSVRENLDFIARLYQMDNRKERIDQAIETFNIGKKREHQLAGSLSGGFKQRLSLAAATIHEPKLLLLDEPTAGVDPKARREFWQDIRALSEKGVTTLVSTHYMDEAEDFHRLAYIANGRPLAHGTLHDVIKRSGLASKGASPRLDDVFIHLLEQSQDNAI